MKKLACSLICLSVFVAISAEAKKEVQTILLRVRVNGKEQSKVLVPLKANKLQLTINQADVGKALKAKPAEPCKDAVKKPEPKVKAPAAPAPSVKEEAAPSVEEDGGLEGIPDDSSESESRKEKRSDLAPAPVAPIPTEPPAKCESHFYEKWWFWTIVGVVAGSTIWKVGDHNGWWDIPIYDGNRRHR
ncbi:MAG: hypothetical protein V1928_03785 [Parcubacteria group bacterium]